MIHAYFHKPLHRGQMLHEMPLAEALDLQLLITKDQEIQSPVFAQDIWPNCELIKIKSINDASKILKAKKLRWFHYPLHAAGRGKLIAQTLAKPEVPPFKFPITYNNRFNFGIFTLLNDSEMLLCLEPWKKVPLGQYDFIEDKVNPPNRAYLKLWEALCILNHYPKSAETCIDLGASPGGWTWVLAQNGAKVIAVDKSELAPNIARLSTVTYLQDSAFALDPTQFTKLDWLVCDVICYPERSLKLIQAWLEAGVQHLICTIKLQGEEDWDTIHALKAIPRAQLIHLYQNKHELTFIRSC